jgi:hypothetical protein
MTGKKLRELRKYYREVADDNINKLLAVVTDLEISGCYSDEVRDKIIQIEIDYDKKINALHNRYKKHAGGKNKNGKNTKRKY